MNFNKLGINTNGRTCGKMKTHCPKCRDTRRNKADKPLSVSLDTGLFMCHYCGWKGSAAQPQAGTQTEQSASAFTGKGYGQLPAGTSRNTDTCELPGRLDGSGKQYEWLTVVRGIPGKILKQASVTFAQEYMPQTKQNEECICFNYLEEGELVNTKYRSEGKNFKMIQGAELIPYNIDGILGTDECIITEGEIDALSFMHAGRQDVISVPGGANRNLSWIDRFISSHFDNKKVIYLATDYDRKGRELRDELRKRLGPERCRIVTFIPGCKDANDQLMQYGPKSLLRILEEAPEPPLSGVFSPASLSDKLYNLFENGLGKGADTGLSNFDEFCTFETGRLCLVTGVPGAGKSEFVDEIVLRLSLRHSWPAAFFSPENLPLEKHISKHVEKLTGKRFQKGHMPETLYKAAIDYLTQNVSYIVPDDNYSVDTILGIARELVYRKGIRQLIIDPYNRIDHHTSPGLSETQYISYFLDRLSSFAIRHNCLVILVAHPRKMNRDPGQVKDPVPSLYDVNGSAHFFNKCDFGLVVERDRELNVTRIHIGKVKFRHLGECGQAVFQYDDVNGRYMSCKENKQEPTPAYRFTGAKLDHTPWIKNDEATQQSLDLAV